MCKVLAFVHKQFECLLPFPGALKPDEPKMARKKPLSGYAGTPPPLGWGGTSADDKMSVRAVNNYVSRKGGGQCIVFLREGDIFFNCNILYTVSVGIY